MTRPRIWRPAEIPTIWVDFVTGRGVSDSGQSVTPRIGERRKNPNLWDLLETAHALGAERIMLTGRVPQVDDSPDRRHWLIAKTPGWTTPGHWLRSPATGRFVNELSGRKVEVRTVAEWFGTNDLAPAVASQAWQLTAAVLGKRVPGAKMFRSPAATGQNAWALSLPRDLDPQHVSPDLARIIHATAGQHRQEHLVASPLASKQASGVRCRCGACLPLVNSEQTPKIDAFAYVDGRFMYGALLRELGTGGTYLDRARAAELLESNPYARARYRVRFTVPESWAHVGLLGVQHEELGAGWHYPNKPGTTFETWADSAEVHLARTQGWLIEPLEAIQHAVEGKVADTFAERLKAARNDVQSAPAPREVSTAAAAALRLIVLATIGGWASRGNPRTVVAQNPRDVPPEHQATVRRQGDILIYTVDSSVEETYRADGGSYRPEMAAQVWGRARARVLSCPTAHRGHNGGALAVEPGTLLGINGDAIYTSVLPRWSLPVDQGGGDDGNVGRMRLQGLLSGPIDTPATVGERNRLRGLAEAAGVPLEAS